MTKFVKIAAVAAALLGTAPAFAATSVTGTAPSATARIIKPLTLTATGSLNFGTIVMNNVSANQTVTLADTGALTCGAQLVCAATGSIVTYNVQGTNGQVVNIIKNTSNLSGSNGGSLTLTPVGQPSVTLTNSGSPGKDFTIGGTFVITPTTIDGVYSGTVDVQVDYN